MVGLINKLLLGFIEQVASLDAVKEVKSRAGIPADRVYRIDEAYSDQEWQQLFEAACDLLALPQDAVEQRFANHFYKDSLRRFPRWFEISKNAREFLERQPRIHNGFATGVQSPAARKNINDKFHLEIYPEKLIVHYRSPNQLCGLYKALAHLIIQHYGDSAFVSEPYCSKLGYDSCELHITWYTD